MQTRIFTFLLLKILDMKWVAIVLLSLLLLILPIKISTSLYYEKGFKKVYFGLYLFLLRILSGSFCLTKNGIDVYILRKKFSFKYGDVYKNRNKLSFPKLMALLEVSVTVKSGEGVDPSRRLFLFACLSNAIAAFKPVVRQKYPVFRSNNLFAVVSGEEKFQINLFVAIGFNLIAIIITLAGKLYGVLFNGKDKSKQNRRSGQNIR